MLGKKILFLIAEEYRHKIVLLQCTIILGFLFLKYWHLPITVTAVISS